MAESMKILELRDVVLRALSGLSLAISDVSLIIRAGESCVISVKDREHGIGNPLFDLAQGVTEPDEGLISFMGRDWRDMTPTDQSKMRGRIGRVFETQGWISNLSVRENISLSQRHHTKRSEDEIAQEVEHLCSLAGLDAELEQRPEYAARGELQKSQWVRAFLGSPVLVLLEHPEVGVPPESVERLISMTGEAIHRGAAVVWMTSEQTVLSNKQFTGSQRLSLSDGKLISARED